MDHPVLLVIVIGTLGLTSASTSHPVSRAWPMRVSVESIDGKPTAFRAVSLGGELILHEGAGLIKPLTPGDTLAPLHRQAIR